MLGVPFAERVVEVITDRGEDAHPRFRYGSGCIVAGRTVLTAGHVIDAATSVSVRFPDKREVPALVDWSFVVVTPGLDLALVEIDDPAVDLPPLPIARVDRDSAEAEAIDRVQVVGYPQFAERPAVGRETAHSAGHIPVLAGLVSGLLTVQVTSAPRPLPDVQSDLGQSQWSGISGAPVTAAGWLLGVVSEHAARQGPSAITAVPVTMLDPDPAHPGWGTGVDDAVQWWGRLGVTDPAGLRRVPARSVRPQPEYWATVREVHARTPQLVGRQAKLAEIAAFATGPPGYRWLVGDAWAGKTALLAEAVVAALPPEVEVVAYFASRRVADADGNRFLAAVVPQLEYLLDEGRSVADQHRLRHLWERAAATGRHLLLVADGLDEDLHPPGVPSIASLLPARLGAYGHVLVASRPYPELPGDVEVAHPLRTIMPVPLPPSEEAGHLAALAQQELADLLRGERAEVAAEVFGVLTAAGGPLAVADVAALAGDLAPVTPAAMRRVRHLVVEEAARSMQPVGPADRLRYTFAHGQLQEQAQADPNLAHPDYRRRIHRWARAWAEAGWPLLARGEDPTPRYLLDTYPATLRNDPDRLALLAADVDWVTAALLAVGVDRLLVDLAAVAGAPEARALIATLRTQATALRRPYAVDDPSYLLRQVCLGALELGENHLAVAIRARLQALPDPGPVPLWTTRRTSSALIAEFHPADGAAWAVAVFPDGRVISGGDGGRGVLVWDPAAPSAAPVELGRLAHWGVAALATLPDGRVVSGGGDGRVLVWDPAAAGAPPIELGCHDDGTLAVAYAVAVGTDGRVVSGGADGRVLMWASAGPDAPTIELGRHDGGVLAVAVMPSGQVISSGDDQRILMWDPDAPGAAAVELGHDIWVRTLAVAPDGQVIGGSGDRLLVWDTTAPGALPTELGRIDSGLEAVAVAPDGRVISGSFDGRVLVWDPRLRSAAPTELSYRGAASAVAVAPDGRVIHAGYGGRMQLWDPAAPGEPHTELGRANDNNLILALAVLPDGRVVSSGASDGRRLLMWDPDALGEPPIELGRADGLVRAVAVTPDGRVVSDGANDGLLMWDPDAPGTPPVHLSRHGTDGDVEVVAVASDGRVVSGGGRYCRVLMWDPDTPGAPPVELGRHKLQVRAVAIAPDGRVISAGYDKVVLWDPSRPGVAVEIAADARAIAIVPGRSQDQPRFLMFHYGHGISMWSLP